MVNSFFWNGKDSNANANESKKLPDPSTVMQFSSETTTLLQTDGGQRHDEEETRKAEGSPVNSHVTDY